MGGNEIFLNINSSRISSENRIISLLQFLMIFQPGVVCIQEIDVVVGMKIFKKIIKYIAIMITLEIITLEL